MLRLSKLTFSFVVDSADSEAFPVAKEELHTVMSLESLAGIPLLVLGNKIDLPNAVDVQELIDALDLKRLEAREVSCYGISAKEQTNLETVLEWLIKRANH